MKSFFFFILYEYIFVWLSSPLYSVRWLYNSRWWCTAELYSVHPAVQFDCADCYVQSQSEGLTGGKFPLAR